MNRNINFKGKTFFSNLMIICLITCFFSCSKKDDNNTSTEICQAILDDDQDAIFNLMEELTASSTPMSTATDAIGHEANYNDLINQLNEISCLTVSDDCYACIRTLPALSMIRVKVNLDGTSFERILNFSTPIDGPLLYLRRI